MERLRQFVSLMQKWNRSIRLVGDASDEALERHIEDALALTSVLPQRGRLVDVGSGNGLPAIPVALACPTLTLTLVEPIAKKVAFLRECRRTLALDNVTVVRCRDDELLDGSVSAFDIAISQATFAPSEWLERGRLLVVDGGLVIAMLGENRDGLAELDIPFELVELETNDARIRALAVHRAQRARLHS